MTGMKNTIDVLGDEVAAGKIIDKTIDAYEDDTLTRIGNAVFRGCSDLSSVNLPFVTSIGGYAFRDCTNLESVNIPLANAISDYAFNGCSKLTSIDLHLASRFGYDAFSQCSSLAILVLRMETVCVLGATSIFNKTPFASGGAGGTVYVPAALIEQYQTATNWSTLYAAGTCNFVAIEGSEYE